MLAKVRTILNYINITTKNVLLNSFHLNSYALEFHPLAE